MQDRVAPCRRADAQWTPNRRIASRRLGNPVVLLQYTGENHGVRKPENRKDYSYRMLDFFNHYLKEEEAPKWWRDGIKHLDMEEHIEDYKKEKSGIE